MGQLTGLESIGVTVKISSNVKFNAWALQFKIFTAHFYHNICLKIETL